jgi:chemotaxis protein methyltransferase CheR
MLISMDEVHELLKLTKHRSGYDFSGYAEASMQRRINRFAEMKKLDGYPALKRHLLQDTSAFDSFITEITVNVTEMFRDPAFFKCLQQKVFPSLTTYPYPKVWHAGCSTGEEVYSLAVLLQENNLYHNTRLYATDINSAAIQKAKNGIYPLKLMKEYTTNYMAAGGSSSFSDYYIAQYDSAIMNKGLKQNVVFSIHNLVSDHSFNEFNLVVCRNVLIYFNRALQEKVFSLFYESLSMFGFLALGSKESMISSNLKEKFEVVDRNEKIFRKIR